MSSQTLVSKLVEMFKNLPIEEITDLVAKLGNGLSYDKEPVVSRLRMTDRNDQSSDALIKTPNGHGSIRSLDS